MLYLFDFCGVCREFGVHRFRYVEERRIMGKEIRRILAAAAVILLLTATASAACTEHRMDGGVVTLEPTCDTIGIITYTCRNEGCGYSYTEKLGNLGHRYVDGVCVTCGAHEDGTVPEETVAVFETAPAVSPTANREPESIQPPVMLATTAPETADPGDLLPLCVLLLTLAAGTGAVLLFRRAARA